MSPRSPRVSLPPGPGWGAGGLAGGRPGWGWRLALFILLVLGLILAAALVSGWLRAPWATGRWPPWWGVVPLTAAVLGASWFAMERVERTPLAALGLPVDGSTLGSLARGTAVGALLTGAACAALAAAGWLRWTPESGTAVSVVLSVLQVSAFLALAALAEELLFRGYAFQVLAEGLGGGAALAITSAAFGLVHAANPAVSPLALVNIGLAGVVLGLAYWRTYDLWFATGVHFGWNWVMGVPVDLPVSGITLEVPGWEAALRGPAEWTGGTFGPEGGLVVTLVSVAGIVWLWRTRSLSRNLAVRALRPLPDRRLGGSGRGPADAGPTRTAA